MEAVKLQQAVILAGGRGERLRPLTDSMPKPMAPVNGIPFLDYLINSIIMAGIDNILILLGYKAYIITNRYKNINKINIEYSFGTEKEQTGRRILNAYEQLDDYFLLMYGDNYWPIEIENMWINYNKLGSSISTTVFSNANGTGEYGLENNIVVGNDGMVIKYDKKRKTDKANGVDIGYFIISKESLNPKLSGNVSFEEDILPQFIANKNLGAYMTDHQYYYITDLQALNDFENIVRLNNVLSLPNIFLGV